MNEDDFTNLYAHTHGEGTKHPRTHSHSHPNVPHSHYMRAICGSPECEDFPTHDIHAGPERFWREPQEDASPE